MVRLAGVFREARDRRRARRQERRLRDRRDGVVPEGMAPLRIATWNIHSSVGTDARFDPARIAEVIRSLDVDLIALQEVGWHHRGEIGLDQFAFLAEATGMSAYAGPTKHNPRAHYGNCILSRRPLIAFRPFDISVGPHREPRGAVEAVVETGGNPVRVIAAHLGLDPWERAQQVERILAEVDGKPDLPTVFMGDLNEWTRNSPRLRRLTQAFEDVASPRSFHARLPTLRLDRIYVRHAHLAAFEVIRTKATRHASDHLPVRAVIGVGAAPLPHPSEAAGEERHPSSARSR